MLCTIAADACSIGSISSWQNFKVLLLSQRTLTRAEFSQAEQSGLGRRYGYAGPCLLHGGVRGHLNPHPDPDIQRTPSHALIAFTHLTSVLRVHHRAFISVATHVACSSDALAPANPFHHSPLLRLLNDLDVILLLLGDTVSTAFPTTSLS